MSVQGSQSNVDFAEAFLKMLHQASENHKDTEGNHQAKGIQNYRECEHCDRPAKVDELPKQEES
ncbi:MAG TPA: hypothetical protein VGI60_01755 [Chthoniobacterales bacterium]